MSEGVNALLDSQFLGHKPRSTTPIQRRPIARTSPRPQSRLVIQDIDPGHVKTRKHQFLPRFDPKRSTEHIPSAARVEIVPILTSQVFAKQQSPSRVLIRNALRQFEPESRLIRQPEIKVAASKRPPRYSMLQLALVSLALLVFGGGIYASLTGVKAEHATQIQAAKLTAEANAAVVTGVTKLSGQPAATTAISTVKPTANAVSSYEVAPNLPKYLKIPSLGVDARVGSVGVTASGALGTPDNVYDTDWYNESAEPGQQGAMLIDGHISSWTAHGVFYGLKDLKPGDAVQVVRGDNTVFNYVVVKTVVYPSGNTDMTQAMTPVTAGVPGLNLISCDGDVIAGTSLFNERIVVFTQQVGS